jgi:3-hydroxyisobutyrate dehydrogenase
MAAHLLQAGHRLTVSTRTRARAAALLEAGAGWADNPAATAAASDLVISMVGYPADVEAVYFGADGLLAQARPGLLLVDMSSSRPDLAERIAAAAAARGAAALDAPVSGGDVGAREARLSIMAGGDPDAFAKALPVLRLLGREIVHHGPPGSGQRAKLCNQIAIAGTMLGVCEALAYATRAGLDADKIMRSIGGGAAGSWTLANLGPRMLRGDFAPGFFVKHFIKDLRIALDSASALGMDPAGIRLALTAYERLAAAGHADSGTQALYLDVLQAAGAGSQPPTAAGTDFTIRTNH